MKPNELLIYSDMDGTMLCDWKLGPYVPERNLEALKDFIASGGAVSIASGRMPKDAVSFFDGVGFSAPLVLCNGSLLWDQKEQRVLDRSVLPRNIVEQAAEIAFRYPDRVWLAGSSVDGIWTLDSGNGNYAGSTVKRRLVPRGEFFSTELVKVCYVCKPQDMTWLNGLVNALDCAGDVTIAQSDVMFLEIMGKGVSKASGIAKARKLAGIEDRVLVCMGDYFNDLEMLLSADISACPCTAADGIRQVCDVELCSNNDGAFADLVGKLSGMASPKEEL